MLGEALGNMVAGQRNRPISVATAIASLFLPGSLLIFLNHPDLWSRLGLGEVLLLSSAISFPVLVMNYQLVYGLLKAIWQVLQEMQGKPTMPAGDMLDIAKHDDGLEWPCLFGAGWLTIVVLYVVVAFAHWRPIRIADTLLLVCGIQIGGSLAIVTGQQFVLWWYRRALRRIAANEAETAALQERIRKLQGDVDRELAGLKARRKGKGP